MLHRASSAIASWRGAPATRPVEDRRIWLARGWLRLRAWLVWRGCPGAHPVAELIARGEWAALDQLMADLDGDPPA